jgi:hypothetical protein
VQVRWLLVAFILGMLAASDPPRLAARQSRIAKEVVGRIAQAGIEQAMKAAAQELVEEAVSDAVRGAVVPDWEFNEVERYPADASRRDEIGSTAGEALENAMFAANVASNLDTALDVADAAKSIQKAGKALKKIKKLKR